MSYLNVKEVSILLKVSTRTVKRYVEAKKLLPINPQHSKGHLFEKSKIDEYLKAKEELQDV